MKLLETGINQNAVAQLLLNQYNGVYVWPLQHLNISLDPLEMFLHFDWSPPHVRDPTQSSYLKELNGSG